jgi:hypothetical protein
MTAVRPLRLLVSRGESRIGRAAAVGDGGGTQHIPERVDIERRLVPDAGVASMAGSPLLSSGFVSLAAAASVGTTAMINRPRA